MIFLGGNKMVNKIGKITLYVNNQEEAKKFWTEKLNFVVKFEKSMGPTMKWLEVGPSESEFTTFVIYDKNLMMSQNPATNVAHPSILLSTTDIENAYKQMKENGVEVGSLMNMPYGKMYSFKDQDGNEYMLREDR
jgi:lactoylglutathione lyase